MFLSNISTIFLLFYDPIFETSKNMRSKFQIGKGPGTFPSALGKVV